MTACASAAHVAMLGFSRVVHAALVWSAINGQWLSSCIGVLLELHIPDLLAKEDKPIALKQVKSLVM